MTKLAIVSDIHLKLRQHADFELGRFNKLMEHLETSDADIIVFNGDLIDIARPTLEEIKALTDGLDLLSDKDIFINSGNHEAVTKHTSTYDYLPFMRSCPTSPHEILKVEDMSIRLTDWKDIHTLHEQSPADILITHYRSRIEGLFDEEVESAKFISMYNLVILGDIHDRYSPASNVFYTGCPYPTHYVKDSRTPYGYIELTIDGSEFSWKYIDLDLPKKIRLDITVKDIPTVVLNPEYLYKIYLSGTLDELTDITFAPNVTVVKLITQGTTTTTTVPTTKDVNFFDALTVKVNEQLSVKTTKTKQILLNLQGD